MDDVPILLYRGMSEEAYERAKARGYFESSHRANRTQEEEIEQGKLELATISDPEEREHFARTIEMWEADVQARDCAGEYEYTFWADTYSNAAQYGPVVVTIRTQGIEHLFGQFPGRPGEWVSTEPVPFSAMHGAQLQLKRNDIYGTARFRRRPDVRVHRHRRTLK